MTPVLMVIVLLMLACREWWRYYFSQKPSPYLYSFAVLLAIAYAAFEIRRVWPRSQALNVFLDLETTGMLAAEERITEIGLVELAGGEFVDSWSQLVNPEKFIPPFIEALTGISNEMVEHAPTFEQLAPGLFERLEGKLLIAHNARFDCGFLKSEFERVGLAYQPRVLCTVKLSHKLFPEHRRHNLDSLILRHGLSCSARHRALGDAEVLWQFLRKIQAEVDAERINVALRAQLDRPAMPAAA